MTLHVGETAPAFTGTSDDGREVTPDTLRGRWTVLFFYLKAGSSHCALEARRFQRALPEFERLGAQVIGVSTDPEGEQGYFRSSCVLSFPLVADDGGISEAYGVLGASPFEGEVGVRRAARQTFLIAPDGRIARHWQAVDPGTHADEVAAALREQVAGA